VNNDPGVCGAQVNYATPLGTDNCPAPATVQTAGLASGSTFPVGQTVNTFEVTDASGLKSTCSFTVTVNDAENPAIVCPGDVTVGTDPGVCGAQVIFDVQGKDNCPDSVTVQTGGLASGSVFPVGQTVNSFEVTDAAGLKAACSFTVTVNDTENPAVVCPGDITMPNDPGQCSAVVTYDAPSGTDNCPGAVTVQTAGLASGATYPAGQTVNTFEVTDAAGLKSTCSFTVTVNDTEKPKIIAPRDVVARNDKGLCSAALLPPGTPQAVCDFGQALLVG
jgi:hypothetical protein